MKDLNGSVDSNPWKKWQY